jgi:glucose-6-phosphate isomerase
MLAITAQPQKAIAYGIEESNILPFWDWVGGRYSLWSAIGLPIAIAIGWKNFEALLQGANAMDTHFRDTPFAENMPVILALLGIWYINFFQAHTHAIIPYSEALRSLPAYLQQLDMESNGKSVDNNNQSIDYHTAPIIWGAVGTNSQHSCHQLLHQGTEFVPVDFIIPLKAEHSLKNHHDILFANCLAQAQALMIGRNDPGIESYKIIPGNKPSNMISLDALTPYTLGALIVLYEHKVFAQGVIWNINSFDQWGVELGKKLSNEILQKIKREA